MHTLNISQMQDFIYHVVIRNNEPAFVWGSPGIGKSQGVMQLQTRKLSQAIKDRYCVKADYLKVVDIRLSQYESCDLRGLPDRHTVNVPAYNLPGENLSPKDLAKLGREVGITVWDMPATLPFVDNPNFDDDTLYLIFLDEANSASTSVSAVTYQLVQEHRIGEHVLRKNVAIMAAGNREGDRGVTNRQPMPLSNRFTHVEAITEVRPTCEHFQDIGMPEALIGFLHYREALLNTFDPQKPEKAFATPRTWEKAGWYYLDEDMPTMIKHAAIAGAVGDGNAAEWEGYIQVRNNLVPLDTILKHPTTVEIPKEASAQYALSVAISGAMSKENITPFDTFMRRMPAPMYILAWQLAKRRHDRAVTAKKLKQHEHLLTTDEFMAFARDFKQVFQS